MLRDRNMMMGRGEFSKHICRFHVQNALIVCIMFYASSPTRLVDQSRK